MTVEERPIEILLVEDNRADADLLTEVMKEAKVVNRMSVVTDGVEAMSYLRRRGRYSKAVRPDLILLDLKLPKKDGREVLAEIKKDPELRRIPVIVLTTSRAETDVVKSYYLHANCYISKPVDLDRYIEVVKGIEDFWLSIARLPTARP
jgi:CheY-like chemotaxis protein